MQRDLGLQSHPRGDHAHELSVAIAGRTDPARHPPQRAQRGSGNRARIGGATADNRPHDGVRGPAGEL
jgi:hypothetical protein